MDNKPAKPSRAPASIASWRWGVIWLMFVATRINYMDRQTLMSTAKHIKDEFQLGEEGYGWIEFWFGISYGLMQIPAGYLADRLNLRWLYVFALLLWSAAGAAQDVKSDLQQLQGSWIGSLVRAGGKEPSEEEKLLRIKLVIAGAVLLIFYGLWGTSSVDPVQARLTQLGSMQARTLEELELQQPFFERTIKPLAVRL